MEREMRNRTIRAQKFRPFRMNVDTVHFIGHQTPRVRGKRYTPNGDREIARRRRQIEAGRLRPVYPLWG